MKLYSDKLPFLKANLHCHTTASDGRRTPDESMRIYQDAGYDILAITDHRTVTVPKNVPDDLLMIPGLEIDYRLDTQWVHILGLGVNGDIVPEWNQNGTPQEGIDTINRFGGIAVLAHPAWSLNSPDLMRSFTGLAGVEIWNTVSSVPHSADRSDSSSLLDVTWASGGPLIPVLANDDTHFYDTDAAVAATMIQAEERSVKGVMDALRKGAFYATLGPRIHQIEVYRKQEITVRCSPAEMVIFYSDQPWTPDRTKVGHGLTECVYQVQEGERFVRVEIRDTEGRKAWSAPIALS